MTEQVKLEKQEKDVLVIYHDKCIDGFTAAWAAWKFLGDSAEYVPASYGEKNTGHEALKGVTVYIVDFSFPREELERICEFASRVVILDHHKTAQEDLTGDWPDRPKNLEIVFDMERSGAGITWDYFAARESAQDDNRCHPRNRPDLVRYVEDRDLWRFKYEGYTKKIHAYLTSVERTFAEWSRVALYLDRHSTAENILQAGEAILRVHDQIVQSIIQDAREVTIYGQDGTPYKGLACNCTGQFASDVGNSLAISSGTFGGTYYSDKDGSVKWSLRSNGDYDVSQIAKQFGGGGHRNAAGFTLVDVGRDTDREINLWAAVPP